jgi:UrcA family protein
MKLTISALAAAVAIALAGAPTLAAADGVRLVVGDLSSAAGVTAFDVKVAKASHRLCLGRVSPRELDQMSRCQAAVRAEAMASLTPQQLQAYEQSQGGVRLASAPANVGRN